jgi:two-component system response regulator HydG
MPGDPSTVVDRRSDEPEGEGVLRLSVTAGPDLGLEATIEDSTPQPVLIGQSPVCTLQLTDPQVSRRHAALEFVDGDLWIRDLGSTNGTFVDRVKIREAALRGGEIVRLGGTVLQVEREEIGPGEKHVRPAGRFGRVIGKSREMLRIYPLCQRLAATHVPVVIEGETGTGKEALAESIHEMGPRADGPFVVFDCTAIPSNLVESELFGHERGAFTGAITTRKGLFEQAHNGTLLIDEIGDLDLALQPKLLRAIERYEIRRVGGDKFIQVNVRVLSATRRDLDREVQAGRFRDDLFHRLAVARVELPPLRNRKGDITALATYFWSALGGDLRQLSRELLLRWEDDPWPGNVRELKNTIARQLALGDLAVQQQRPSQPTSSPPRAPGQYEEAGPGSLDYFVNLGLPYPQARDRILEEFEQRFVEKLLAQHGGDVARAAAASGIGRRYFQKLKARTSR